MTEKTLTLPSGNSRSLRDQILQQQSAGADTLRLNELIYLDADMAREIASHGFQYIELKSVTDLSLDVLKIFFKSPVLRTLNLSSLAYLSPTDISRIAIFESENHERNVILNSQYRAAVDKEKSNIVLSGGLEQYSLPVRIEAANTTGEKVFEYAGESISDKSAQLLGVFPGEELRFPNLVFLNASGMGNIFHAPNLKKLYLPKLSAPPSLVINDLARFVRNGGEVETNHIIRDAINKALGGSGARGAFPAVAPASQPTATPVPAVTPTIPPPPKGPAPIAPVLQVVNDADLQDDTITMMDPGVFEKKLATHKKHFGSLSATTEFREQDKRHLETIFTLLGDAYASFSPPEQALLKSASIQLVTNGTKYMYGPKLAGDLFINPKNSVNMVMQHFALLFAQDTAAHQATRHIKDIQQQYRLREMTINHATVVNDYISLNYELSQYDEIFASLSPERLAVLKLMHGVSVHDAFLTVSDAPNVIFSDTSSSLLRRDGKLFLMIACVGPSSDKRTSLEAALDAANADPLVQKQLASSVGARLGAVGAGVKRGAASVGAQMGDIARKVHAVQAPKVPHVSLPSVSGKTLLRGGLLAGAIALGVGGAYLANNLRKTSTSTVPSAPDASGRPKMAASEVSNFDDVPAGTVIEFKNLNEAMQDGFIGLSEDKKRHRTHWQFEWADSGKLFNPKDPATFRVVKRAVVVGG